MTATEMVNTQPMESLNDANGIRVRRATEKRDIAKLPRAEQTRRVAEIVLDPPRHWLSAKAGEVMQLPARWGQVRALAALTAAGVNDTRRLRTLDDHERTRLADHLLGVEAPPSAAPRVVPPRRTAQRAGRVTRRHTAPVQAEALRLAEAGWPLAEIVRQLAANGHEVPRTTVDYWVNPHRREQLAAYERDVRSVQRAEASAGRLLTSHRLSQPALEQRVISLRVLVRLGVRAIAELLRFDEVADLTENEVRDILIRHQAWSVRP